MGYNSPEQRDVGFVSVPSEALSDGLRWPQGKSKVRKRHSVPSHWGRNRSPIKDSQRMLNLRLQHLAQGHPP